MTFSKLLAFVVLYSISSALSAASFNCDKASTSNEHAVCNDALLSTMDEHYSRMYLYVRGMAKNDAALQKTIKMSARAAFRSREMNCADNHCLRRWYQEGRERLSQQLWAIEPESMQKTLTPRVLFNRLNLLTFNNIDHQRARYFNKRYLSEFYPESSVNIDATHLRIEHEDNIWEVRIKDESTIEIHNRILNASYNSTHTEALYYDPVAGEFRAGSPALCNLHTRGSKPEYSSNGSLQHLSHGEIGLYSGIPAMSMPVFDKPAGEKAGALNIQVTQEKEQYTGEILTSPIIRLCNTYFETLVKPSYQTRLKYQHHLLFFDWRDGWINLSSDSTTPAWIAIASLPESLAQNIKSRENVMTDGTGVIVRSPHRLRAEPNTNSEILHVLKYADKGESATIQPIEITGDWMKVDYIRPNPIFETEPTDYKKMTGWIKWRERPGKEYVSVDYSSGL